MLALYIVLGVIIVVLAIFVLPGFFIIGARQVGVLTRKNFGERLPEGQIVARTTKQIGIQAATLMPGFYWRFPILWSVKKVDVIVIQPDQIGVLKSIDGKSLTQNRLLADEVECDSFQDALLFYKNGGCKGPQVGILKPGTYRINTEVFDVKINKATEIGGNEIGVLISNDGIPLPSGMVIAPEPVSPEGQLISDPQIFQNAQLFINNRGYRGPQLHTLQPGRYYINTLLFNVQIHPIAEVAPGYVAVIRSNVGVELEKHPALPDSSRSGFGEPVHEDIESLLITDKNKRGIWRDPVAPGKYNLNPLAFTPYLVPTSAVTIDWASGSEVRSDVFGAKPKSKEVDSRPESEKATEFFKFSQLRVTSKDGFQLDVDVRMVIRISPANAAFIIARFGSVANLIEQIVHPLIDSSFRNKAGEKKAIEFVHSRTELQAEALSKAKDEFSKYFVEAQNLLIAYIDVDKSLLETQTKREIATQQQEQYGQEALAQEKLIAVKEKEARANKQKDVIDAQLSIQINADKASAAIKEAEGKKQAIILEADGIAHKNQVEGEGVAKAFASQAAAIGSNQVYATIKVIEELSKHNIKLVPDTLITGSEGNSGNIMSWLLAGLAKNTTPAK